jgi:hypothetical protein
MARRRAIPEKHSDHEGHSQGTSDFFSTYIGNAPHFVVKSIGKEGGVAMATFFGTVRSLHLQEHISHLVVEEGWGVISPDCRHYCVSPRTINPKSNCIPRVIEGILLRRFMSTSFMREVRKRAWPMCCWTSTGKWETMN